MPNVVSLSVTYKSFSSRKLCWISLCWVSLCRVSLCWLTLCWVLLCWVSLCRMSFMLNVTYAECHKDALLLSVIMINVVMMIVIIMNCIMTSVIILNVMAPVLLLLAKNCVLKSFKIFKLCQMNNLINKFNTWKMIDANLTDKLLQNIHIKICT